MTAIPSANSISMSIDQTASAQIRQNLVIELAAKQAFIYHYVVRELIDTPKKALTYLQKQPETKNSRALLMLQAELSEDDTAKKIYEFILEKQPTFCPARYGLALVEYRQQNFDAAQANIEIASREKRIDFSISDLMLQILKAKPTENPFEASENRIKILNGLLKFTREAGLSSLQLEFERLRKDEIRPIEALNIFTGFGLQEFYDLESAIELKTLNVSIEEASSFLYFINRVLPKNPSHLPSCAKLLKLNEKELGHLMEYWLARGLIHEKIFLFFEEESSLIEAKEAYFEVLKTGRMHPGALHGLAVIYYKKFLLTKQVAYLKDCTYRLNELEQAYGPRFGSSLRKLIKQKTLQKLTTSPEELALEHNSQTQLQSAASLDTFNERTLQHTPPTRRSSRASACRKTR